MAGSTLGGEHRRWECPGWPYGGVVEGQVELGGGSAEMLLLGVLPPQPPSAFPSPDSLAGIFGGLGNVLAPQLAI